MMERRNRLNSGVLATIAFCALLTGPAQAEDVESLQIATLNCEFLIREKVHKKFGYPYELTGADKEKWDQPGYRDEQFAVAAETVAKKIAEIGADVIGLVEVGDEKDVKELWKAVKQAGLDYRYLAVCDSKDKYTGQHVAVFSKLKLKDVKQQIPGREFFDEELDDEDRENSTDVSKALSTVLDVNGKPLNLYVVHLSSERGGHEQDQKRVAQSSIVRRTYLPKLSAGEHVVVVGDFNDHRGQPTLMRIRGRDDIFEDLIQTGKLMHFAREDEDERWTYSFRGIRYQIDHILVSQSLGELAKIRTKVIPVEDSVVSDHRGLAVDLTFKQE